MFSKMSIMKSTEIYSQQIKRLKAALDTADTVVIGAGATVPLTGFGSNLAKGVAKGVAKEVTEKGWLGVLTGGLTATAGGITAAVLFGVLAALVFKPGGRGNPRHQIGGSGTAGVQAGGEAVAQTGRSGQNARSFQLS